MSRLPGGSKRRRYADGVERVSGETLWAAARPRSGAGQSAQYRPPHRVHGASGVVLITGESGIGKTALLSEICRQAAHSRIRVAEASATKSSRPRPARRSSGCCARGGIRFLTGVEFHDVAGLAGEPLILVDRIAEHLERLAASHRVMIAVDDVQWADRLSRYALRC